MLLGHGDDQYEQNNHKAYHYMCHGWLSKLATTPFNARSPKFPHKLNASTAFGESVVDQSFDAFLVFNNLRVH